MSFVRNINEVEPKKVNGETIYEMVTEKDGTEQGVAIVLARESKLHHHNHIEELYFVASENPQAVVYLDDRIIPLKQDDVVYIAPGTKHKIEAKSLKELKIYVVTRPHWNEKDHHLDE